MTEIIPPGKSSPNVHSSARAVVINELPEQFRNLDIGTIVEGKVIPSNRPQQVLIQTQQGLLNFLSKTPYPVGTEVTLEVKLVGAKPAIVVLSATPPPTKTDIPLPPQAPPVLPQPAASPPVLQAGLTLPAQVVTLQHPEALPPALSIFVKPGTSQPTPPGTQANPTTTAQQQPSATPQTRPNTPIQTAEQNALASFSRSTTQASRQSPTQPPALPPTQPQSPPSTPSKSGNPHFITQHLSNIESSVKSQNIAASGRPDLVQPQSPRTTRPTTKAAPTPPNLPLLSAKIINVGEIPPQNADTDIVLGRVVGQSRNGDTLLQIPGAVIRVPAKTDLPQQTPVTIKFTPLAPLQDTPEPARIAELAGQWRSVQDTHNILSQLDASFPNSFAHNFQRAIQQMPALLLFFMGALKSGDVKQWLGEERLEALEQSGHKNLVDKLTGEFEKLGRLTESSNEWRSYYIPLFDDESMKQARLYIRHQQQQNQSDQPNDNPGTRFILDVSLSRMGAVQLDGLIRQKRFDLTLRTNEALPDNIQKDIREIYQAAHEVAGLNGQLVFSVVKKFPIDPLAEVAAKHPD